MKHIMVDLETFSTANNALIVTLGAVLFDANTILDRFSVGIEPSDAQRYGLHVDAATVMWWMDPERDAARRILFEQAKVDLDSALMGFKQWVEQVPEDERGSVWGNGATFDNVKLKSAYDAARLDYPFTYKQDECYRTLKNRCPNIEFTRVGLLHVAVDDAESQATHLQAICRQLGVEL